MNQQRNDLFWTKVEKTEGCWYWAAAIDQKGYGRFWDGQQMRLAHRLAVEIETGSMPVGHLDHECRNASCVNPSHLREVSRKQNMENRPSRAANNTSGYRGVSIHKTSGLWQAKVAHHGQQIHLGYFKDAAEAGEVARLKRLELYTHNELDRQQNQGA